MKTKVIYSYLCVRDMDGQKFNLLYYTCEKWSFFQNTYTETLKIVCRTDLERNWIPSVTGQGNVRSDSANNTLCISKERSQLMNKNVSFQPKYEKIYWYETVFSMMVCLTSGGGQILCHHLRIRITREH